MDSQPTWLVTGASGFLGANVGHFLEGIAHRIAVTRSGDTPPQFDGAIAGDLVQPDELLAGIRLLEPDVILHAAAMASHEACESAPAVAVQVNATATGALAYAAQEVGARFIYISTDAVFDGERGHYAEKDTPAPTSVYGRTKLRGEEEAGRATDALIIRTNFFGWSPSGQRSILEFFVNELEAGQAVRGFTDFTTTSAYAQVLASTVHQLVDSQVSGIFHVTSPDAATKYEFGVSVAHEFGLDANLITPTTANIHPPRRGDISLDVTKVQHVLGRTLPTQREGIHQARLDDPHLRAAVRRSSPS